MYNRRSLKQHRLYDISSKQRNRLPVLSYSETDNYIKGLHLWKWNQKVDKITSYSEPQWSDKFGPITSIVESDSGKYFTVASPIKTRWGTEDRVQNLHFEHINKNNVLCYFGYIKAPYTAKYTFRTKADDGVKLSLNTSNSQSAGQQHLIIDNWMRQAPNEKESEEKDLIQDHYYPFQLLWFDNGGGTYLDLEWKYEMGVDSKDKKEEELEYIKITNNNFYHLDSDEPILGCMEDRRDAEGNIDNRDGMGGEDIITTNYNEFATLNDGSCEYISSEDESWNSTSCEDPRATNYGDDGICNFTGCTDKSAEKYFSKATVDDDNCVYQEGCMDVDASNYDANADKDDDNCVYQEGCMDTSASNYDANAVVPDDNCVYQEGCMDESALNYDKNAVKDGGDCVYLKEGCMDESALNYDADAFLDNGTCSYPLVPIAIVTMYNLKQRDLENLFTNEEKFRFWNNPEHVFTLSNEPITDKNLHKIYRTVGVPDVYGIFPKIDHYGYNYDSFDTAAINFNLFRTGITSWWRTAPKTDGDLNFYRISLNTNQDKYVYVVIDTFIKVEKDQKYTFALRSDMGRRLYFDNKMKIDNWQTLSHGDHFSTSCHLKANEYHRLKIEYLYDCTFPLQHYSATKAIKYLQLYWKPVNDESNNTEDLVDYEFVPSKVLYASDASDSVGNETRNTDTNISALDKTCGLYDDKKSLSLSKVINFDTFKAETEYVNKMTYEEFKSICFETYKPRLTNVSEDMEKIQEKFALLLHRMHKLRKMNLDMIETNKDIDDIIDVSKMGKL